MLLYKIINKLDNATDSANYRPESSKSKFVRELRRVDREYNRAVELSDKSRARSFTYK